MGIDLRPDRGFQELLDHVGHRIECVTYGTKGVPVNAAIECIDCGCVLLDFDSPAMAAEKQMIERPNLVFVFGSNEAGMHGGGAARHALERFGAEYGVAHGLQGRSYAIPTCDRKIKPLKLGMVELYVQRFLAFARDHDELEFLVTKVGCGIAGFTEAEIAPLFKDAPDNCLLPEGWRGYEWTPDHETTEMS